MEAEIVAGINKSIDVIVELIKFQSGFILLAMAGLGWTATKAVSIRSLKHRITVGALLIVALVFLIHSTTQLAFLMREFAMLPVTPPGNQDPVSEPIQFAIKWSVNSAVIGVCFVVLSVVALGFQKGDA